MKSCAVRWAGRGIAFFLVLMALFTLLSVKLDALRTPQVLCCTARQGLLDGQPFGCVVPAEALFEQQGRQYVYLVSESTSPFYAWEAHRAEVRVIYTAGGETAIEGLYAAGQQIVRFADMPLTENTLPVQPYEGPS